MTDDNKTQALVPTERIAQAILVLRGQKVLLDADLTALYGGQHKALQRAGPAQPRPLSGRFHVSGERSGVRRFEVANCDLKRRSWWTALFALRFHGAWGDHGAAVLNSPRAVEMSVYVVRAFVRLREFVAGHQELAKRLDELEQRIGKQFATHDQAIAGIINTIRQLMAPPPDQPKRPIGFVAPMEKKPK